MNDAPPPDIFKHIIPLAIGSAGALARWFHEILTEKDSFRIVKFPLVTFVGGFLGYMGGTLVGVWDLDPSWTTVAAGAFGASGSYAFEVFVKLTKKIGGGGNE